MKVKVSEKYAQTMETLRTNWNIANSTYGQFLVTQGTLVAALAVFAAASNWIGCVCVCAVGIVVAWYHAFYLDRAMKRVTALTDLAAGWEKKSGPATLMKSHFQELEGLFAEKHHSYVPIGLWVLGLILVLALPKTPQSDTGDKSGRQDRVNTTVHLHE